jgi:hypothetical protein
MIQHYKLDKLFGPSGTFAGYLLLIVGLITVYFTLAAIPLILLGGIMAFSYFSSQIDTLKKRYRMNLNLFGFYPIGKWIEFQKTDDILYQKFTGKYTAYSRSNRQINSLQTDFRVVLLTQNSKKKIHLAKFTSEQAAREAAIKIQQLLQSIN